MYYRFVPDSKKSIVCETFTDFGRNALSQPESKTVEVNRSDIKQDCAIFQKQPKKAVSFSLSKTSDDNYVLEKPRAQFSLEKKCKSASSSFKLVKKVQFTEEKTSDQEINSHPGNKSNCIPPLFKNSEKYSPQLLRIMSSGQNNGEANSVEDPLKSDLQEINYRLSHYIQHVRDLRQTPSGESTVQLHHSLTTLEQEIRNLKNIYETELDALRLVEVFLHY